MKCIKNDIIILSKEDKKMEKEKEKKKEEITKIINKIRENNEEFICIKFSL